RRSAATLALQRARIEVTALRILDEPVFHAVQRIAGADDRVVEQPALRLQETSGLVGLEHLLHAHGLNGAPGPVEPRRSGDDAVEVVRKALRLLHHLAASRGAAIPVRV